MKKYLLLLLLFAPFFSIAQHCSKSDLESAYGTIKSHEIFHQSGNLDLKIILTSNDTSNILGWSFTDSFFTVSLLHGFTKSFIDSSDTASIYFNLSYDSTNLPYYPKELVILVNATNKYGDTFSITVLSVVYFTLYGTTEIWDMEEFQNLPRKWLPKISPAPERVYVAQSSIPTSTRIPLDSIHIQYEWQTQFALAQVENLPYAIEMAAYHPDTIALYAHLDSSYMDSNLLYKRHLFPQKFSGTINGKLEFKYINDNSIPVTIPLSGVNLKLVESDPMGRVANTYVTEASTDINGNFSLVYTNLWQRGAEGDEMELILRIESKNENYNIKVLRKDLYAVNRVLNIVKEDILFVLDPVGKNANVDLGTIMIDDQFTNEETKNYYKICSWAFMAYKFLESQVNSNFMWRDLEIAFNRGHSDYFITTLGKGKIRLKPDARNHESTIWHEFGHFVMDRGFGMAIMKGVSGSHTFNDEHNFHFAWSEGWATGFMGMLDVFYNNVDKETGIKKSIDIESRSGSILNRNGIGNGVRSEYHIACAINDLYDGSAFFENNSTQPNRWNDDQSLVGADGYDLGQIDNVSLSASDLVLALEDQPKSIGEYYAVLMRKYSDCNLRKEIKRVFDQNRVVLNTANLKSTNDNEFSSDAIDMIHDMEEHLGFLNNIYTSFRTDIIELNDNFISFNLGTETDKLTKSISDNIVINSATLFFNANRAIGFENNGWSGTNVLSNSRLTSNVCADRVTVSNNGLIEVGDGNGLITSTTKLLNESVLEMNTNNTSEPSSIRINNNSKLIIEVGGTLEIFPGSRIILNGDNAILEIKGNLIVHEGATFTFEGGSAGSGHVIFNIDKDDTPKDNITLEVDSKIKFVGNNSNDRVMEVPADAVFWLENPQASFEISNGFVALGRDALLNIAIPVTMNNVRYYAESGSKARSIVLWGQKHNILDVEIENVKEGLQSFNAVGGWPLKLNNVEISGADRGLLSEGKGATLTYFESEGNIMGIHISGSIWPNTFQNPKVTGAIRGTLFTGSSASNLVINKANYENNLEGVNFTGSGDLVLSCGKFHNIPGLSCKNRSN